MDNKKKKDLLIIVMLIAVVCMSGAFAMLNQKLEVRDGNVEANWNVEITNVVESATQGNGISESVSSDLTMANFAAGLSQPGDSVTYTVTVENKGNIDAKLSSISSTATPGYGTDDNPYIIYTYDGITSESVLIFTITPRRPVNNSSPEKNKAKYNIHFFLSKSMHAKNGIYKIINCIIVPVILG